MAIAVVEQRSDRWASATFTGSRHRLTVTGPDAAGAAPWLDALPEAEFRLRGHLVADLTVAQRRLTADGVTATIEALTLEER